MVHGFFQQQKVYQSTTLPLPDHIGEDWSFCDRIRDLGYDLWLDHTEGLKHTGPYNTQRFEGTPDQPATWWIAARGLIPGVKPATVKMKDAIADAERMEELKRYLESTKGIADEAYDRISKGEPFAKIAVDLGARVKAMKFDTDRVS